MINNEDLKVLLVDDSSVITLALERIINSQPDMRVMGVATDPYEAVSIIKSQIPDVIILDIQMPKMDGLTFLGKIMKQHPIPVVVFSSVAQAGSKNAMLALRLGAVSVLPKPEKVIANKQFHHELIQSIKEAYAAKDKLARMSAKTPFTVISADRKRVNQTPTRKIIAIGASTGGTAALQYLLPKLHHDIPGLVIVQHMPGDFTRWFAEGLNRTTIIKVQEAEAGAVVCRGNAYIANGFFHLKVKNRANQFVLSLQDGKEVNRHKPSVDVLFNSLAETAGDRGIGILLTGMGDDGAKGLLNMKKVGAVTIAQDQNSSIVYGMPREAVKLGAAKYILSLDEIVSFINNS